MAQKMAAAIANAVVDEIQANAKATVQSGSSAGIFRFSSWGEYESMYDLNKKNFTLK